MLELLQQDELPEWFSYPEPFLRIARQGLVDMTPWHLLTRTAALERRRGLRQRYPSRDLVPFARRQDNDDVACWDSSLPTAVVVIHDFSSSGTESRRQYPDFWAWFRGAVEDMIGFED